MNGATVRGRLRAAKSRSVRAVAGADPPKPVSRAARMLALAHHVERLVEAGELSGYAEAARSLGLTRARLTQVMKLLLLAPEIQHALLLGELRASERSLRSVTRAPDWGRQVRLLARARRPGRERGVGACGA